MAAQLTRSQHLASFLWLTDSTAIYSYGDEDAPNFYKVDEQSWVDMGKPAALTITVEPGDLLNG
jgi:hypothetical protein